ncbi:U-box domain-containing protein 19-like, partial [Asparagus officinalis]|uniref:U-box domain-containing protein 19-like n=1 Tax=Asparagus officinalis TaxID=4686 RepID=UPI00098E48D1
MNADRVLSEFRAQIRAISTALDVLPLDSVGADEEMKEMIGMITRQSWKVEVRIDREDDRAIRAVRSILDLFERGVSPDPADLRRLLSYLGVTDWDDCNGAITFMEEEIFEHCDDEDNNGEAGLLGSLLGLLIYCRAVLFNVHANVNPKKCGRREDCQFNDERSLNFLNPDVLRCPISLDLMLDPVTISTGQTYDRESILRWFKDGLDTCPVTGEKLKHTNSVPNSSLQKLVRDFCILKKIPIAEPSKKKKRDLGKTLHPQSLAAVEATRMTAVFLAGKLSAGSGEEKNRAAYEIRLLAKSSLFHRICLVEADCVPWLLHLVSSSDPSTQDNVVAALLNISKHPSGRTAIFEVGGASLIVNAITDGLKVEIQQNAAAILFYLSSVREYR